MANASLDFTQFDEKQIYDKLCQTLDSSGEFCSLLDDLTSFIANNKKNNLNLKSIVNYQTSDDLPLIYLATKKNNIDAIEALVKCEVCFINL